MKNVRNSIIAALPLLVLLAANVQAQLGSALGDAAKQVGSAAATGAATGAASAASNAAGGVAAPTVPTSGSLTQVIMQRLGVSQQQATGGAGAVFGLAKSNMAEDDFSKVAAGVPGIDSLLAAAPATGAAGGLTSGLGSVAGSVGGAAGSLGSLAGLAGSFTSLGMSADMATKFVPICVEYVQGTAGPDTAALLQTALQ